MEGLKEKKKSGKLVQKTSTQIYLPYINNPPHISPEPGGCSGVGLVLSDENRMRHR